MYHELEYNLRPDTTPAIEFYVPLTKQGRRQSDAQTDRPADRPRDRERKRESESARATEFMSLGGWVSCGTCLDV